MPLQVLQRPHWHGTPIQLEDLFRLTKKSREARAALFTHQLEWEVRLLLDCSWRNAFQTSLTEAGAPHTLEWSWQAASLCRQNPAHFEVAKPLTGKIVGQRVPHARRQQQVLLWHV